MMDIRELVREHIAAAESARGPTLPRLRERGRVSRRRGRALRVVTTTMRGRRPVAAPDHP